MLLLANLSNKIRQMLIVLQTRVFHSVCVLGYAWPSDLALMVIRWPWVGRLSALYVYGKAHSIVAAQVGPTS